MEQKSCTMKRPVTHLQVGCPGTKPRVISSMKISNALLQKPWSEGRVKG